MSALTLAPLHAQDSPRPGVLHGHVREAETGEAIGLAGVLVDEERRTMTERDGYFRVPALPPGQHRLRVSALGFATLDTVLVLSAAPVELRLRPAPIELAGITARADRPGERPWEAPEVSVRTVTPGQVRRVPAALEADLFRSLQALPGVISPGALSGQLLVRGGAADQNLFLLDGYPVLHPYHLLGAFSVFPVDAVRNAELWTAAPPARYGGRLSSVLDVALKDGNGEQRTGTAALGLVSSSAGVEGPHARGAWFVGARSTYLDLVTREVLDEEVPYRFFDMYAKTYADLSPSDRISALGFWGRDMGWRPDSHRDDFGWTNEVYGLSWRHLFGGRAVFEPRLSFSRFREHLRDGNSNLQTANVRGEHRMALAVAGGNLRLDLAARHRIEAGYSVERRTGEHRIAYFVPGYRAYPELNLLYAERAPDPVRATTWALYAQDDVALGDALRLRLGLRGESEPAGGWSVQPRVAAKYLLSERLALTAGAGLLRQRLHLLQDPDADLAGFPVDIWLSAEEPGIPVAEASHLVGGVESRLPYGLRLRAEVYRKDFEGLVTVPPYDPTDRRFAIERLERATGQAQGIDVSLGREGAGPVRGWAGYSLASSTRTTDASTFPADPHPRQRFVAVADAETRGRWT
ncbi:MAG: TonB-dependent receptor, partial [Gemmatimonadota bacterium]|nr:TonB-dependent receptor [Gemmatimonadota bacterium]